MIKGGYKIIDFKGATLSGSAETLDGIYAQIVDNYDKTIMVSGVSLNGYIMDDAYASVQEKTAGDLSKSVELTVYGGVITVTEDDEVTFALYASQAELTEDVENLKTLTGDVHIVALPQSVNTISYRIKTEQNYMSILAFASLEMVLLDIRYTDEPVETKITENSPFSAITNTESKARQFEITVKSNRRICLIGWAGMSFERI